MHCQRNSLTLLSCLKQGPYLLTCPSSVHLLCQFNVHSPTSQVHFVPALPHQRKEKEEIFPRPWLNLQSGQKGTRTFQIGKKALLVLRFKLSTVDGKSVEDPETSQRQPGVIACIRDTRGVPKDVEPPLWSKGHVPRHQNSQVGSARPKEILQGTSRCCSNPPYIRQ